MNNSMIYLCKIFIGASLLVACSAEPAPKSNSSKSLLTSIDSAAVEVGSDSTTVATSSSSTAVSTTTPGVTPGVAAVVTAAVTPGVTPGVTAVVTAAVTPAVTPEVTPEVTAVVTAEVTAVVTPTAVSKICTRTVMKEFSDGVGIKINSVNYGTNSDGQCNTSCHWANKGYTGCATRDCKSGVNDSICYQCIYQKEVDEQYGC